MSKLLAVGGVMLAMVLALGGCGGRSEPRLISAVKLATVTVADIDAALASAQAANLTTSSSLGGYDTVSQGLLMTGTAPPNLNALWQQMEHQMPTAGPYVPLPFRITFARSAGAPAETGLLIVPMGAAGQTFPLLSLQHPTQVERQYSPSRFNLYDNEFTMHTAVLLASMGWIVSVPDYPGMGDNYEVHPYCLESLGVSVVGMIKADLQVSNEFFPQLPWNGKTYLMGFSEGGYATMVAAKEIQAHYPELNLVAVAPLDGPYSLSVTMRGVMRNSGSSFQAPYFLPYTIAGYAAAYLAIPELQFGNAILADPPTFSTQLYRMLDGSYTGGAISTLMKGVAGYSGPISVTSQAFRTQLNTSDGVVNQVLAANDGFRGWTPQPQFMLYHHWADDLVPEDNTEQTMKVWNNLGNVKCAGFYYMVPDLGSVHAGALPFAYIFGTKWLNGQAGLGPAPTAGTASGDSPCPTAW